MDPRPNQPQRRYPPSGDNHRGEVQASSRKLDYNSYATKKTVASALLIISVITNNVLMLKNMIQRPSNNKFYWPLVSMLIASLALLMIIGTLSSWLGKTNIKDKMRQRSANILNNTVAILSMFVLLLNITVSAFEMGELYHYGRDGRDFNQGYLGGSIDGLNSAEQFDTRDMG